MNENTNKWNENYFINQLIKILNKIAHFYINWLYVLYCYFFLENIDLFFTLMIIIFLLLFKIFIFDFIFNTYFNFLNLVYLSSLGSIRFLVLVKFFLCTFFLVIISDNYFEIFVLYFPFCFSFLFFYWLFFY